MRLYVGNLPFSTTVEELTTAFSDFKVSGPCKVVTDKETGRAKGFGFVEVDDGAGAIQAMNGKLLQGRPLRVSEALQRPRP